MKVLLFHDLRKRTGREHIDIELPEAVNQDQLWELLSAQVPELAPFRGVARIARNQTYAAEKELFHPNDEVALIPPVSGG